MSRRLFLLRFFGIVFGHDSVKVALLEPQLQCFGHGLDSSVDSSLVLALELVQHVVNHGFVVALRVTNADLKARVFLGAQVLGDRFNAVVTASTALAANAQVAYGQVHVVLDDGDVFWVDVVEVGVGADGDTA